MSNSFIDKVAKKIILLIVLLLLSFLLLFLTYIFGMVIQYLSLKSILLPSQITGSGGGIRDQLFNSVYMLLLTLIISLPLSIGSGIYLAEFAPKNKLVDFVQNMIDVLSYMPSIVVGLFIYLIIVIKFNIGFSILAGSLALTIFNLPILTANIKNAFCNISQAQRDAGKALGLSEWNLIKGILLPQTIPTIIVAVVLSAGRIFGEAAALIYSSGQSAPLLNYANWNPFCMDSPLNIMRPAETLSVYIWKINSEGLKPDAEKISFCSILILVGVILLFDLVAHFLGNYLHQKFIYGKKK